MRNSLAKWSITSPRKTLTSKLTSCDFKRVFSFATAETYFLFLFCFFFWGVGGVAMGSPQLLSWRISLWATIKRSSYRNIKVLRFCFIVVMCMISFVYYTKNKMPLHFSTISNSQHPNIPFTLEKEIDHGLPFLMS